MIPIELEIKNFLAYRNPGPLRLEGIHVACLTGPNGAGKSSILDAITWALWGKARTNSPDDLIHQVHGEHNPNREMSVELTFEHNQERFKVIRKRKAGRRGTSLLELQIKDPDTGSWRGISEKTMRDTQRKTEELLGLDYETFVNSAFLVQGRADQFTTKTPSQRKQVLANILGLSKWEVYEDRAKSKITEAKSAFDYVEARLEEIDQELAQREKYEAELTEADNAAQRIEKDLTSSEKQWADLEGTRSALVALQRQIDDLSRRIMSREKELEELESDRAKAGKRSDNQAIQSALEQVQGALSRLEPLQNEVDEISKLQASLAEEIAHLKGVNEALGPETEPIKDRVKTLESATEPVCPTCGQPLDEGHREQLLGELKEGVEKRRGLFRSNRDRVEMLDGKASQLKQNRVTLDQRLAERPALQKRLGELEAALEHAAETRQLIKGLDDRISRWNKDLKADLKERKSLEKAISDREAQLKSASLTLADLERLRLDKRLADERVGGARQQISALESFEAQRKDRQADQTRLRKDINLYSELREAFGKRGVPAMIIETAVPELERSANDLLARMSEGRMHIRIETQRETKAGDLREALGIIISDELGSRPYEMYSGGEAFRINFAIRIALSRLLARRAGAQLRSLFIDEGFGTQDASGRENLVAAINSIQHDFDRILVITHIDELKNAFPARIEVVKTPEGSQFQFV